MSTCPQCGTQIPEDGSFCPSCGQSALNTKAALVATGRDRVLAALAYFLLPAIAFIVLEPFKRNHFVRFHAFQALFVWAAMFAVAGAIKLISFVLLLVPSLGQLTMFLLWILFLLAVPVLLLLLFAKALMGEEFELPVVGSIAKGQAGGV